MMTDAERIAQLEQERKEWRDTANFMGILLNDMDSEGLWDFGSVEHEKAEGMELTLMFIRSGIRKTFASTYNPEAVPATSQDEERAKTPMPSLVHDILQSPEAYRFGELVRQNRNSGKAQHFEWEGKHYVILAQGDISQILTIPLEADGGYP